MKTLFLATAAALACSAAPASAQLLGGSGGLGGPIGGLGGTLGGSGSGTLGGTFERVREPSTTTTRTSARADGNARSGSNVDRRSGRVDAAGGAETGASTVLDGTSGATGLNGNGAASGSASGGASADLIGTDEVRGLAGGAATAIRGVAGRTGELATGARDRAIGTAGAVRGATGSASGGGTADGTAGSGVLALSGTAAADALGSFTIAPGMEVTDLKGRTIGTIRNVVTNTRGRVEAVRMHIGKRLATVPAANFTGSGDVLVSAASKGELNNMARGQSAE